MIWRKILWSKEQEIDFERTYTPEQTADKLSRIAEVIEAGESFRIQVGGHRLRVPTDGEIEIVPMSATHILFGVVMGFLYKILSSRE